MRTSLSLSLPLGAAILCLAGCGGAGSGPPAGETISRETFVEAYHRLRTEALRSPDMEIGIQVRDSILAEMGITDGDLLTFAEVWGSDGDFMIGIWEEVDSLLREDRMRGFDESPSVLPERPGGRDPGRRGGSGS